MRVYVQNFHNPGYSDPYTVLSFGNRTEDEQAKSLASRGFERKDNVIFDARNHKAIFTDAKKNVFWIA